MALIGVLQYLFLASIVFDVIIAIWFYKSSRHLSSRLVRLYYFTITTIIIWEIVTYISFFVQRGEQFNFIFNASTFSFGFAGVFLILNLNWHFFDKRYLPLVVIRIFRVITIIIFVVAYIPGWLVGDKIFSTQTHLFYLSNAPLTVIFYLSLALLFIVLTVYLLYGYLHSSGIKRREAKILMIGFGVATVAGVVTYVLVPLFVKTFWVASDTIATSVAVQQIIGSIFVSVLSIAMAYAILRYRIFAIHFQIRRTLIYIILYTFIIAVVLGLALMALQFLSNLSLVAFVILVITYTLIVYCLLYLVTRVIRKFFPQAIMDLYKFTERDYAIINSIPSLEAYVRLAISHFLQTVPVDRFVLYVYDHRGKCFQLAYPSCGQAIPLNEPWLKGITQHTNGLELKITAAKLGCTELVPIFNKKLLLAVIGLGNRTNTSVLSRQDREFIKHFQIYFSHHLMSYLELQYQIYQFIDYSTRYPHLASS